MLRLPATKLPDLLVGHGQLSPAIEWRLVDLLFEQVASFLAGTVSMLLVGLLWWMRTRSAWALWWTAVFAITTLARLLLAKQYKRNAHAGEPMVWARRFATGACAIGAVWGAASLVVVAEPDPFVQFLVISVQSGFLAAAAARNSVSPAAAIGQVALARIPLLLACLATGNVYYICFGLFVVLHIYGSVTIIHHLGRRNLKLLLANGEKAALIEQLRASNAELEFANRRLEALAAIDGLTGLLNRRVFDITLSREWYRSIRQAEPLSLLMIDIDCFKEFNDRYGHVAGDDCLKLIARTTEISARRATDLVARYGGEEFAMLLPNTDMAGAIAIAERTLHAIEALGVPHAGSPAGRVTASVGVASFAPAPGSSPESLVRGADIELYRAKQTGRNQVCAAGMSPDHVFSAAPAVGVAPVAPWATASA